MTKRIRFDPDLELAALHQESGRFERALSTDVLIVPKRIELTRGRLVWSLPIRRKRDRGPADTFREGMRRMVVHSRQVPSEGLLKEFVRLADAPEERFLEFARKWGVFGICKHGLPASHNPGRHNHVELSATQLEAFRRTPTAKWMVRMLTDSEEEGGKPPHARLPPPSAPRRSSVGRPCRPRPVSKDSPWRGWEPISAWRQYSGHARAILRTAARAREGDLRWRQDEWDALWGFSFPAPQGVARSHAEIWELLAGFVNDWLEVGNVRPTLLQTPRRDAPTIVLATEWNHNVHEFGLFGAIAVQLMFAVSGERGLAWCAGCGEPFEPSRRLTPSRRHFCAACGRKAMMRAASADYRARRAASVRGHRGANQNRNRRNRRAQA
jgi:hypothetical protein